MAVSRMSLLPAAGAVLTVVFLIATDIPLGIPGEWTWNRQAHGHFIEHGFFMLIPLAAGFALLEFSSLGTRRLGASVRRFEVLTWLVLLAVLTFVWLSVVQTAAAPAHWQLKPNWVLYDPGSSGYFLTAQREITGISSFLAGYEQRVAEGDVLHLGTHPPGLFLFHHSMLELCKSSTALTDVVLSTQPSMYADAFTTVEREVSLAGDALTEAERAALWLAALLTQFIAALTVVPIYVLARQTHDRSTAWRIATLWPFVPALAVFLPRSDALLPLFGTAMLASWLAASGHGMRRQPAGMPLTFCVFAGGLSGLCFWLGMMTSLAVLPVALLCFVLTAGDICTRVRQDGRSKTVKWNLIAAFCGGVLVFLLATAALYIIHDLNMFNVWMCNIRKHAGFYEEFERTWWKWSLVNPVELSFAVGLPVAFVVGMGAIRTLRERAGMAPEHVLQVLSVLGVWGLLHISGKNLGEAARLWLFVIPWFLWLVPLAFHTRNATAHKTWRTLVVCQMIVCVVTTSCVSGFRF